MIVLAIHLCSVRAQIIESVTFNISEVDRVAGKSGVEATFTFAQKFLSIGSVTLNYPLNFFARSPTPTAIVSTPNFPFAPQQPQNTSMILLRVGPPQPAQQQIVTVTLVGCTLGPAREASDSVTVQTQFATSDPVSCLQIFSAAVFDSITISSNGAGSILGPTSPPVIVFTPSISIPSGGHVVLKMPNGYFAGVVTVVTGGVAGLQATASISSTSITITFDAVATGVGNAISLTLMGLTLSATSVTAGIFELYTSVEP